MSRQKRTKQLSTIWSKRRALEGDGALSNDGGEYCICRGPDDYQTMIACDLCDEWYHCSCVGVKEDNIILIDKYICGKCQVPTVHFTTWKPLCRLPGCGKLCDLAADPPSKYCTPEHKRKFWQNVVARAPDSPRLSSGGALTKQQVKALLEYTKGANAFHTLGKKPTLSIPEDQIDWSRILHDEEKGRLDEITRDKIKLKERGRGLGNRKEMTQMAIARVKELSSICGWDKRLATNEEEFDRWRKTEDGIEAFKIGCLGGTFCGKKGCTRHKGWVKLSVEDVRFELEQVRKGLENLLAGENAIKERAKTRAASQFSHSICWKRCSES